MTSVRGWRFPLLTSFFPGRERRCPGKEGGGNRLKILRKIFRFFCALLGAGIGYQAAWILAPPGEKVLWAPADLEIGNVQLFGIFLGALIGFTLFPLLTEQVFKGFMSLEKYLARFPTQEIIAGSFGLIFGLLIGLLIVFSFPIDAIPGFGVFLRIFINLLTVYLGVSLALRKREDIAAVFRRIPAVGTRRAPEREEKFTPKILDTSVIIDGRIADVCRSGFLEGTLVIPEFILEELRHIADSSDLLKRNRGRRGLDILNQIQKDLDSGVEIIGTDFEEINQVDSKLVRLAQNLNGKIMTNDYNLNKVAELQGVEVLNVNELANAVKPVVLPGEEMRVKIVKEGKEQGQGVAYLDDGTMIVVDQGKNYLNEELGVVVTSILQTAAGRMIFARLKNDEQKERTGSQ